MPSKWATLMGGYAGQADDPGASADAFLVEEHAQGSGVADALVMATPRIEGCTWAPGHGEGPWAATPRSGGRAARLGPGPGGGGGGAAPRGTRRDSRVPVVPRIAIGGSLQLPHRGGGDGGGDALASVRSEVPDTGRIWKPSGGAAESSHERTGYPSSSQALQLASGRQKHRQSLIPRLPIEASQQFAAGCAAGDVSGADGCDTRRTWRSRVAGQLALPADPPGVVGSTQDTVARLVGVLQRLVQAGDDAQLDPSRRTHRSDEDALLPAALEHWPAQPSCGPRGSVSQRFVPPHAEDKAPHHWRQPPPRGASDAPHHAGWPSPTSPRWPAHGAQQRSDGAATGGGPEVALAERRGPGPPADGTYAEAPEGSQIAASANDMRLFELQTELARLSEDILSKTSMMSSLEAELVRKDRERDAALAQLAKDADERMRAQEAHRCGLEEQLARHEATAASNARLLGRVAELEAAEDQHLHAAATMRRSLQEQEAARSEAREQELARRLQFVESEASTAARAAELEMQLVQQQAHNDELVTQLSMLQEAAIQALGAVCVDPLAAGSEQPEQKGTLRATLRQLWVVGNSPRSLGNQQQVSAREAGMQTEGGNGDCDELQRVLHDACSRLGTQWSHWLHKSAARRVIVPTWKGCYLSFPRTGACGRPKDAGAGEVEEAGDAQDGLPLPPSGDSWEWPLSRSERRSRASFMGRQVLLSDQRALFDHLQMVQQECAGRGVDVAPFLWDSP